LIGRQPRRVTAAKCFPRRDLYVERHAAVSRDLSRQLRPGAAHLVQAGPVAVAHIPDQIADDACEVRGALGGFSGKP
jgi:hypothetical protein